MRTKKGLEQKSILKNPICGRVEAADRAQGTPPSPTRDNRRVKQDDIIRASRVAYKYCHEERSPHHYHLGPQEAWPTRLRCGSAFTTRRRGAIAGGRSEMCKMTTVGPERHNPRVRTGCTTRHSNVYTFMLRLRKERQLGG